MTWADDGHQYTSFGDGGGFGGERRRRRRSRLSGLCPRRRPAPAIPGLISGGEGQRIPPSLRARATASWPWEYPLFLGQPAPDNENYQEARLAVSANRGATFTRQSWAFTGQAQGVILPTILQFGQNNAEARDTFMYNYFINLKQSGSL